MRKLLFLGFMLLAGNIHATVKAFWQGDSPTYVLDSSGAGNDLVEAGTASCHCDMIPATPDQPLVLCGGANIGGSHYEAVAANVIPDYLNKGFTLYAEILYTAGFLGTAEAELIHWQDNAGNQFGFIASVNGATTPYLVIKDRLNAEVSPHFPFSIDAWHQVKLSVGCPASGSGDHNSHLTLDSIPAAPFAAPSDALVTVAQVLIGNPRNGNCPNMAFDAIQIGDSASDAYLGPAAPATPTPLPSPTITKTARRTATSTRTFTATFTVTRSKTFTITKTCTISPTFSASPTITQTPTMGIATFYGPGNSGDGFTDTSGAGHDASAVGVVSQPGSPSPVEGDQWFASPDHQVFGVPNYASIPLAVWSGTDGMAEFWYHPLANIPGANIPGILWVGDAGTSNLILLYHQDNTHMGLLLKHAGAFNFASASIVAGHDYLVREERNSGLGTEDIYINGTRVLHTTDYVSFVPNQISAMGSSNSGAWSDEDGLMDALQFGNSMNVAYLGPQPTFTDTPTITLTPTRTFTKTLTTTSTRTSTATPSKTVTSTKTVTPHVTATPTPTMVGTITAPLTLRIIGQTTKPAIFYLGFTRGKGRPPLSTLIYRDGVYYTTVSGDTARIKDNAIGVATSFKARTMDGQGYLSGFSNTIVGIIRPQ